MSIRPTRARKSCSVSKKKVVKEGLIMNQLLRVGRRCKRNHQGLPCEVEQFLGGGGQGEVTARNWRAKPMALKCTFRMLPHLSNEPAWRPLVKKGAPTIGFLWPQELNVASGSSGFGYLMPLREKRFKSLRPDEENGRPEFPGSFGLRPSNCHTAFNQLHAAGLVTVIYRSEMCSSIHKQEMY